MTLLSGGAAIGKRIERLRKVKKIYSVLNIIFAAYDYDAIVLAI